MPADAGQTLEPSKPIRRVHRNLANTKAVFGTQNTRRHPQRQFVRTLGNVRDFARNREIISLSREHQRVAAGGQCQLRISRSQDNHLWAVFDWRHPDSYDLLRTAH